MTLRAGPLLITFLAATLVAVPAAAHVNDVRADPQVSTDGTVVVETAFIGADGWLVLHADDDGEVGEPVGHTRLSSDGGFQTDVTVSVADDVWAAQDGAVRMWVTLHREDGGSGFDPQDDPLLRSFGQAVADEFTLGKGNRALVTARRFAPQEIEAPEVTVRRAVLPENGYLVLHNASDGRLVGVRPLKVGAHANVTVPLNESFFKSRSKSRLNATLYTDDGDGEFDDADDPIRVDGVPVRTTFGFRNAAYSEPTATARGSNESTITRVTSATTDSPTEEQVVVTASPTSKESAASTGTGAPGFGLAAVVLALAAVALGARDRV